MEKEINSTHLKRIRRSGKKTDNSVDIVDIVLCADSTLSDIDIQKVVEDAQKVGIEITPRIKRVLGGLHILLANLLSLELYGL
jgi:hypothetical protein